jgi:hypothetical protein
VGMNFDVKNYELSLKAWMKEVHAVHFVKPDKIVKIEGGHKSDIQIIKISGGFKF